MVLTGKFADDAKRAAHFARHGTDFGASTEADYEAQASRFLYGPLAPNTLQKLRSAGDIVRFNPTTGEFRLGTPSGTIRTYYKPDPAVHGLPSNLDYFNAQ
jgi:filamentous hemagglutinin